MAEPALKRQRFKSIAELERENFNLSRIQEWAGLNFQARMVRVLDRAAAQMEHQLREGAKLDRNGNLKISALNQALALNITADVGRILNEAGYTEAVQEHLGIYSALYDQARKIYEGTGVPFTFDQADIDHLQAIADADASYFGRLPRLGVAAVEKALTDSVLVGANFQIAANAIQLALGAESSWLARYAFTYANDSLLNFNAAVSAVRDRKFKPEYYYYAGTLIKTSRRFCIGRAGKVWTRKEVLSWNKLDWQGRKPGPVLITRGGWNCKHSFIAVTKAWVESQGLEIETEPAPVPPAPTRKKPSGLAGASYLPAATRKSLLRTYKGKVPGLLQPPENLLKPSSRPEKSTAVKEKEKPEIFQPVRSLAEGRKRLQALANRYREQDLYPSGRRPDFFGRVKLSKEIRLETFNTVLEKLEKLQQRAIDMGISPIASFEIVGGRKSWAARMGLGRMEISAEVMNRRSRPVAPQKVDSHISTIERDIAALERILSRSEKMGYSKAELAGLREELENKRAKLNGLLESSKKTVKATSDWKKGDPISNRPFNAADYFEPGTKEAVWKTLEHEFGHHIHQQLFVINLRRLLDPPLERWLKDAFRSRGVSASGYSEYNPKEWWAENYSLWRLGRKDLVDDTLVNMLKTVDNLPRMSQKQRERFESLLEPAPV